MRRAVEDLASTAPRALVETRCQNLACPLRPSYRAMNRPGNIRCFNRCQSGRDAELVAMAERYPEYGFESHKVIPSIAVR